MNLKGISYYLGLFCFPLSFLSFLNILYSSYFDYFLNFDAYTITLFFSLFVGGLLVFLGKNSEKKINFHEQILLIVLIYLVSSILISVPYYLSNYQITLINALFEAFSGISMTGFSIFENIKYLDPTLIIWRSSSQWIGGLYFLIFLVLFFSNMQFNYKLNHLVFTDDKSLNPENNIKKVSLKIFLIYLILSLLIFILFSISGVRLFDGLNLTMSLISTGGFLPTNSLSQIIKSNFQEIVLIISFFISLLNIYFIYSIFNNQKNFVKNHYEDLLLIILVFILSIIIFLFIGDFNYLETLSIVLSSITTSGITINSINNNFTFLFIILTIVGGSLISNTSGIKFIRFYILLKGSFFEVLRLVKPNNIVNQNILLSNKKIDSDNIKISFLIFISFFISLFILSSILLLDNFNFENSFKLSILTITNTSTSGLYGLGNIDFSNLLTSSKISLIIFMIIGKIELISLFLIIKKILFKN